ncbi:MAG: PAS domain-containing sensor histidine kinase [Cyclobacteriaceae bacterium]
MPATDNATLELKKQFENIFEYSPVAIFVHDLEQITNVNSAFLKQFCYETKECILGKHPMESLLSPEDADLIAYARRKVKEGASFVIPQVKFKKKSGEVFLAEAHVSAVAFGGKMHYQIHTEDITESRKAQFELLETGERYRRLFENSLDGIYKSTPEGRFVEVNTAMVEMLGYGSVDELLAIDINTDLYFEKEDRKIMADHIEDQYPLKRKDGSKIWVEDHSYYEYDADGTILFHHGILRDVTVKLEKQNELENLLIVTEDQNKRLQNFAHIISHNIRSHSANMSSLVRFLQESPNNDDRAKLFDMLKISASKLEETIQNLNEIITVNQKLETPLEFRNLKQEVENTLQVLSSDIVENHVSVTINIPEKLEIRVVPAYLDSVLLNIIDNAIKYRSSDVALSLRISAKKENDSTILIISDNGIGIDMKKNAKKLFRMYETFSTNKDSRGFGLYITKNQMEAMGGKIDADSELGKGTTFNISFKNLPAT